jgi:DNA-binding response OmpR family regulator
MTPDRTQHPSPTRRILVVDDEPEVLQTIGALVAHDGHEVVLLSEFQLARRYIDATPPDVLVTDVRLGAFNGLQLALHMREANPAARILVLSAFDDPTIRREAATLDAEFLCKPVTRQALLDAVTAPTSS